MIQKKQYLHGDLGKQVVRNNYGGVTSDSVKITVDNNDMTIRGDVIWDAFIGEVAHKAYPGDKGHRNYQKIIELAQLLNREINRATQQDVKLQDSVLSVDHRLQDVEESLRDDLTFEIERSKQLDDTLLKQLLDEVSRAMLAENDLLNQLQAEVATRTTIDKELQSRLDALSGISNSSVELLEKEFKEDIQDLKKFDLTTSKNIQSLTNSVNSLTTKIDTVNSAVVELIDDSESVDDALQNIESCLYDHEEKLQEVDSNVTLYSAKLDKVEKEFDTRIDQVEIDIHTNKNHVQQLSDLVYQSSEKINDVASDLVNVETQLLNESSTRESQIRSLTTQLAVETNRSLNVEAELEERLDTTAKTIITIRDRIVDQIDTKSAELSAIDSELQLMLSAETHERESEDKKQSDELSRIEAEAISRDSELFAQIEELRDTTEYVAVLPTDGSTEVVYTQYKNVTYTTPVSNTAIPDTIVKRDGLGNIQLPEAIDEFTANNAVSKSYVDSMFSEIESTVNELLEKNFSYEFIDGGTAPI